jgi:hypothetical protein
MDPTHRALAEGLVELAASQVAQASEDVDPHDQLYHIEWSIDLHAENHRDAAERAQDYLHDPKSIATIFQVWRWDQTEPTEIDLLQKAP